MRSKSGFLRDALGLVILAVFFATLSNIAYAQSVVLNSTNGTNLTSEDLTAYVTGTSDKIFYNWRVNGTSVTKLVMPFDGGTLCQSNTKVCDYSDGKNNGTVGGATYNSTGGYDGKGAYSFSADTQEITLPQSILDLSGNYTVSAWIKRNSGGSQTVRTFTISDGTRGAFLGYEESGSYIYLRQASSQNSAPIALTSGAWHYVVWVKEGSSVTIYLDGVGYLASGSSGPSNAPPTTISVIGNDGSNAYGTNGVIDEVVFWNRAISAQEILNYYNNQSNKIDSHVTNPNETWQSCITANNNTNDTGTACSNNLTIIDDPLTLDSITLNSTSGYNFSTDNITATPVNLTSGDKVIYNWKRDSTNVLEWNMPFDGGLIGSEGTFKDYSVDGTNGTPINATYQATSGYDGRGAVLFDGNDYIRFDSIASTTDKFNVNGDYTVSFWLKSTNLSGNQSYISFLGTANDLSIGTTPTGQIYVDYESTNSWKTVSTISTDTWYHIAVAMNSGTLSKIFINGVNQSYNFSSTNTVAVTNTTLGSAGAGANGAKGYIDEFQVYGSILSDTQILLLNNSAFNTIASQELDGAQIWTVTGTPNNNYVDGTSRTANITINSFVPILNSTTGNNFTTDNLTVYLLTENGTNNSLRYFYNWRLNGTSVNTLVVPFDGGTLCQSNTKVCDYSDSKNNGTVDGATYNSTGGYDGKGAYSFSADTQEITFANGIISAATPFSVTLWLKRSASNGNDRLIALYTSASDNFQMGTTAANEVYAGKDAGSGYIRTGGGSISNSVWYHMAVVNNATGNVSIYLNGVLQNLSTVGATAEPAGTAIGNDGGNSYGFRGSIDSVVVWNYTLSPEQVNALYQNKTNLTVSQQLNVSDVWQACVTENDNTNNIFERCSNDLTVRENNPPPNVTGAIPTANTTFNVSSTIEVGVNVTDDVNVSVVYATVTLPNGTLQNVSLALNVSPKYNGTFTIPNLTGLYNVTFVANDTSGNINSTTTTFFVGQDVVVPSVFGVIPASNSTFNVSSTIEVGVNVTDDVNVSVVLANVTLPNGTVQTVALTLNVSPKYNSTFTIPNLTGQYNVTFFANDTSGNINSTTTTYFQVSQDSTPPNVTGAIPSANTTFNVSSAIEVGVNVTDDVNVSVVLANVTLPNGTVQTVALTLNVSPKYNGTFTIPNLTGQYNVTFFANDSSGNVNSSTTTFFVGQDVVVPSVFGVIPASNSTFNVSSAIEVGVNVTDNVNVSVVYATVILPNGTLQNVSLALNVSPKYNGTFTIPNLTGQYNVTFFANDTSGNINSTTTTFFVAADSIPPAVTNLRPVNASAYTILDTIEISANVTDNVGVGAVLANITLSNGTIQTLTLTFTSGAKYNTSYTIPSLTGIFTVRIIANDTSGNINSTETTQFTTSETTPPNITNVIPTAATTFDMLSSIQIAANVTDLSNISLVRANISYPNGTSQALTLNFISGNKYNNTFTIPELAGQYNITFFANDSFNNINNTVTTNFIAVDSTPPQFNASCIPDQAIPNTTITCSANITDPSGVSNVSVNVTLPNSTIMAQSISQLGNQYSFTFNITDQTGNYTTTWFANDTYNNANTTSTIFEITSPAIYFIGCAPNPVDRTQQINCSVNVTTNAPSIDTVLANITSPNGTIYAAALVNTGSTYSFNFTNTQITGIYNISWFANDSVGAIKTRQDNFTVIDALKPNVTNIIPAVNSVFNFSTTIEIAANATDDVGISSVQANISYPNGTSQLLTLSFTSADKYNNTFTIPALLGIFNITIIANDTSGNINNTQTTNFTSVDVQNPSVTNITPSLNSIYNVSTQIEISAQVTDNFAIDTVQANMSIPGGTSQILTLNLASGNKYNNTFTPTNEGTYNITILANDTSGNINSTQRTNFTYLNDSDLDGIQDSNDTLLGTNTVETPTLIGFSSVTVTVNDTSAPNGTYFGTHTLQFYNGATLLANITHNFSLTQRINLSRVTLELTSNGISINLDGQLVGSKTLYVSDNNFISICVKDQNGVFVSNITSTCTGTNEYNLTACIGGTANVSHIQCTDLGSTIRFDNLTHSAASGAGAGSSGGASSGGGGGSSSAIICPTLCQNPDNKDLAVCRNCPTAQTTLEPDSSTKITTPTEPLKQSNDELVQRSQQNEGLLNKEVTLPFVEFDEPRTVNDLLIFGGIMLIIFAFVVTALLSRRKTI